MVDTSFLTEAYDVSEISPLLLIVVLAVGLLFAFFGSKIMKLIAGLVGAILGATFAFQLALFFRDQLPNEAACTIIAAIIGGLIGAYLGVALMKMLICMFFGAIGFFIGLTISGGNFIVALIVGFVLAIIISMVIEQFLAIITAILGGLLVGYIALALLPSPVNIIAFLGAVVLLSFVGSKYQLQSIDDR
jgi:hypothetical protein